MKNGILEWSIMVTLTLLLLYVPTAQGETGGRGSDVSVSDPSIVASISNSFASVDVSFRLSNSGSEEEQRMLALTIPVDAFFTNLTIDLDGSKYYGVVKQREEAQKEYEEAKEEGKSAIKLDVADTEFRLTMAVSPGSTIDVSYRYEEFLVRELGGYEVVITPSHLLPTPISSDVSLSGEVNTLTTILKAELKGMDEDIEYPNANELEFSGEVPSDEMDAPIILTYETKSTNIFGDIFFHRTGSTTYFMHLFSPNGTTLGEGPVRKDIVFVLDKSGSMVGNKIENLKEAFQDVISSLDMEMDRFNIVPFDTEVYDWGSDLVIPNDENVEGAIDNINGLLASGGTNIIESLEKGLEVFDSDSDNMPIIVLLTDGIPTAGRITTPTGIREEILTDNENVGASIFSLGLGDDVDYDFLQGLSLDNYARAYRITDDMDTSEQISHFYDTISTPLMYDLTLDYDNAESVYSLEAPYLFEGQEHTVLGKVVDTDENVTFTAKGTIVDGSTKKVDGEFPVEDGSAPFIEKLWAFMHIKWSLDQLKVESDSETLIDEIVETGVQYQIVTPYTTMIVVAEKEPEETKEPEDVDEGGEESQVPPTASGSTSDDDELTYEAKDTERGEPDEKTGGSTKYTEPPADEGNDEEGESGEDSPGFETIFLLAAIALCLFIGKRASRKR